MEIVIPSIHYTPAVQELLPNQKLPCQQPNCDAVFTNVGNLNMHLQRHHKISTTKVEEQQQNRLYHCPNIDCVYHEEPGEQGKYFKNLKYLRQHYQKVHQEKIHSCESCEKRFVTLGQLLKHAKNNCGRKFSCHTCGWDYDTMEALQTHGKRKEHLIRLEQPQSNVKVAIECVKSKRFNASHKKAHNQHQETQTEVKPESAKRQCMASVQTETLSLSSQDATTNVATADFTQMLLPRDNETQTEPSLRCRSSSPAVNSSNSAVLLDQMLAQSSSHMHTQTCDDFLTELGLADIQTQTNWSTLKDEYSSSFNSLYMTQHTQTCDTLLEGLFGAQENDLIGGGFQSTYTQT